MVCGDVFEVAICDLKAFNLFLRSIHHALLSQYIFLPFDFCCQFFFSGQIGEVAPIGTVAGCRLAIVRVVFQYRRNWPVYSEIRVPQGFG